MEDVVAPLIAELLEHELQDLEVVVLLVANDINHVVEPILLEAAECRTQVLSHIYRCAVATQQQLLVEAVGRKVNPHRVILLAEEYTLAQPLLNEALAQKVGLRLVIYLVEIDAHSLVRDIEALIYPAIHALPQLIYLRILGLPPSQHLLRSEHDGCLTLGLLLAHTLFGHELLNLAFVVLVELDIVLTHQVVALHARRLGGLATAIELPCEHRLADVDAAVVHQVYLDDVVAIGLQDGGHRVAEEVVADVSQVQRLVGVGRRVLNHYGATRRGCHAIILRGGNLGKACRPERGIHNEVKETLYHVETLYLGGRGHNLLAELRCRGLGRLARRTQQREDHNRVVALELLARLLNLNIVACGVQLLGSTRHNT